MYPDHDCILSKYIIQEEIASFSNVGDIILTGDFNSHSPQAATWTE